MDDAPDIQNEMARLNKEQAEAAGTLDGPVLVVAGPGTGKTQLLSLRALNILRKKDVSPGNILCLTFTEAGAEAMTKRLVKFIGRDAYDIRISTFHGFASSLRSYYSEYFTRSAFDTLITDLQSSTLINEMLCELRLGDPLFQNSFEGVHGGLKDMRTFITQFKRSGLTSDQFRAIMQQNLAYMEFVEQETEILALVNTPMNVGSAASKQAVLDQLDAAVARTTELAPEHLRKPIVSTPGIYSPYAEYIAGEFSSVSLYDQETGKTTGFGDLRKKLFVKDTAGTWVFKDKRICEKALSAIDIFERYQAYLRQNALYDFDDMILDAIEAIEDHLELKYALQEQYRYIQVDEFQDTNGVQMKLIDLLTDNSLEPNILVVGDDDQAIMRFQGASVAYINQFEKHYRRVTRCVLKTNYRSTPSLVDLGQTIARQIETRSSASATEKKLSAYKDEACACIFPMKSFPSKEVQYYALAKDIRQRIDTDFIVESKTPHEAIAVIAPVHASLKELIPYLKMFDIPFSYAYTAAVSHIASLQTLRAVLFFVAEYSQGRSSYAEVFLPRILASEELGFSSEDYIGHALAAKRKGITWMEALKKSGSADFKKAYRWLVELSGAAPSAPVREILLKAAKPMLEYYRTRRQTDPLSLIEFNCGLKALLDFTEGELGNMARGISKPPMRLADLTACFAEADKFNITIDTSIPISRDHAVTLTSAHGSKGLEFDLVYLVDAEDTTWHQTNKGGGFLSKNMLFDSIKNDDDARRLLFVAATRARYELEAYRGQGGTVRELLGSVDEQEIALPLSDIELQSEQSWQDNYRLDTADLQALIYPDLQNMKMSVSRLNAFVEYQEGCANSTEFVAANMLRLPEQPSFPLEFGSVVHAFLEDYLNQVVKTGNMSLEDLIARCRGKIRCLDFDDSDIQHGLQRFDGIVEQFIPRLESYMGEASLAELWVQADLGGVPLIGKCDLLVFDEAAKTIKVFDYKTSLKIPDKNLSSAYARQLQFYRLLLENSPEYKSWKVVSNVDLYVEPMKDLGYNLCDPMEFFVTDDEVEHLKLLVQAVWQRIQNGRFDTSAFEDSDYKKAAIAASATKDGSPSKRPNKKLIQKAYEDWLIAEYASASSLN